MIRAPWRGPNGGFSWTTLWLNVASAVVIARLLVGAGLTLGTLSWTPGELDATLAGAIMAGFGGLYYGRRGQEKPEKDKKNDRDDDDRPAGKKRPSVTDLEPNPKV